MERPRQFGPRKRFRQNQTSRYNRDHRNNNNNNNYNSRLSETPTRNRKWNQSFDRSDSATIEENIEDRLRGLPEWILGCNTKLTKVLMADDKVVTQILSPAMVNYYQELLSTYFVKAAGCKDGKCPDGFPGSLAPSILRKDLPTIADVSNDYRILLKSDGTRYILFAFEYEDETGKRSMVAMIDRSFTWKMVSVAFEKSIYSGTVFDGELVKKTDESWVFQVFDVIAYCGNFVGNETHSVRLGLARKCIESPKLYNYDARHHTFALTVKDYATEEEALSALCNQPQGYPIDGIILISERRPYYCGKDPMLFKYKTKHTVDMKMSFDRQGKPSLCISDAGLMRAIQPASFDKATLHRLEVGNEKMLQDAILECIWDNVNKCWTPLMRRYDKNVPNNIETFEKTVKNRTENITPQEMYQILTNRRRVKNGNAV